MLNRAANAVIFLLSLVTIEARPKKCCPPGQFLDAKMRCKFEEEAAAGNTTVPPFEEILARRVLRRESYMHIAILRT